MPGKQPIISEPGITSCRCDRDADRGWARTALTLFYGRSLQTRRRREQFSVRPLLPTWRFFGRSSSRGRCLRRAYFGPGEWYTHRIIGEERVRGGLRAGERTCVSPKNGLNMAVVAGWLLHCELHKSSDAAMTHIAFRRDVTMSLLQLKQKLTVRPGPRVHLRHENRKTDGHYIISTTQGRCAECKKNTTNQ
ncbi:hypothetical protein MRX96_044935 [Rhipicephalus microplus]